MSDYLPARVVTEILCKLPIKSLVQCTCVCKSWYFLIRSPAFISTHLTKTKKKKKNNNNNNKKQLLLLFLQSPHTGEERYTLHLDDEQLNEYLDLHLPPTTCDPSSWNEVIGSCNGVLFVVHHIDNGIESCFFWNPLIRKTAFLPQLEPYSFKDCYTGNYFGFGFDSRDNDYKVLRIARSLSGTSWKQVNIEYEVYSLNAGTWKSVTSIAPNHEIYPVSSRFAFVNGSVHFLGFQRIKNASYEEDGCYSVLAFDLGLEVFHEMMLPKPLVGVPVTTAGLSAWAYKESSIAIVEKRTVLGNTHFCVWFMKEYGAEDSWTKLLVLNDHSLQTRRISGLATFRKNGELLLETSVQTSEEHFAGGLLSCDPDSQQRRNVRFWWEQFTKYVFSYVESLVLLNFDESALTLPTTKPFANASPLDLGDDVQPSGAGLIVERNAEFSVSDDNQATNSETKTSRALPSTVVASRSGSSLARCDDEEMLTELVSQLSAFEQALNVDPSLPEIPAGSASFYLHERDATEVAQTFRAALSVLERGPKILCSSATVSDLRKYLEFLTARSSNGGMQVEQSNALDNILKDLDRIVADVLVQRQTAEKTEETTKLLVLNEHSLQTQRISGLATFRKNGELLLETSVPISEENFAGGLLSYDPESQQFRNVRFWWEEFTKFVFSYVESLVLLNFDESGITLPPTKLFANASPLDLAEDEQTSGARLIVETNAEFSVSGDDRATDRETKTSLALPSAIVASKSGNSLVLCDDKELNELVSQMGAFEQALNIDPILPEIQAESASFHHDDRYATEVAQTFRAALCLLECGPTILSSSATVSDLRKYLEFLTTHSSNSGMQFGQSNALDNILKDLDHIVVDVSVQRQVAEETKETSASLENFKAAFSSEFGMLKAEMTKEASLARQIVELEAKLKALKADQTRAQVKIKDLAKSSATVKDVVANKQSRLQHLLHSEAEANTRFRQIEEMFALAVHVMKASPL